GANLNVLRGPNRPDEIAFGHLQDDRTPRELGASLRSVAALTAACDVRARRRRGTRTSSGRIDQILWPDRTQSLFALLKFVEIRRHQDACVDFRQVDLAEIGAGTGR